jgi:hypothetical protein
VGQVKAAFYESHTVTQPSLMPMLSMRRAGVRLVERDRPQSHVNVKRCSKKIHMLQMPGGNGTELGIPLQQSIQILGAGWFLPAMLQCKSKVIQIVAETGAIEIDYLRSIPQSPCINP